MLPGPGVFILLLIYTFHDVVNSQTHFYPFGINQGDAKMPPNDDGSTAEIPISSYFPFFDNLHQSLYVNNNGLISFLKAVPQYTPDAFPLGDRKRFISPFWADVDTRQNNFGGVYYRETINPDLLSRATEDIRQTFVAQKKFSASWLFIVTWDRVTYFGGNQNTKTNTFQAVITTNGKHSFAIFNYGTIGWTTGTASGGTAGLGGIAAQAGFNAGDGVKFSSIPGSRTAEIINIASTTNVNLKGRWNFQIDNEEIKNDGCNDKGSLTTSPRMGIMLGGTEILASGPCFEPSTDKIICRFDGITIPGIVISSLQAKCYSPITNKVGNYKFEMSIDNGKKYNFKGFFSTLSPEDVTPEIKRIDEVLWENNEHFGSYKITWDKSLITGTQVDVELIGYSGISTNNKTMIDYSIVSILKNAPNTGSLTFVPEINLEDFTGFEVGALRLSASGSNKMATVQIWSDIHVTRWYTLNYIHAKALKLAKDAVNVKVRRSLSITANNNLKTKIDNFLQENIPNFALGLTTNVIHDVNTLKQNLRDHVKTLWNQYLNPLHHQFCKSWSALESEDPYISSNDNLLPCPCNLEQAQRDTGRYEADFTCSNENPKCPFNQGSYHCVKTILASKLGAAQQCCYERRSGRLLLLMTDLGRGRLHRAHTRYQVTGKGTDRQKAQISLISHYLEDVVPYYSCCKWSSTCDEYYHWRPSASCANYIPPRPVILWGDPHIVTLDGLNYTFNGLGEFWVVKIDQEFLFQGRAARSKNAAGNLVGATSWQALAMKGTSEEIVQLELSERRGIDVLINGQKLDFEDMDNYRLEGVIVKHITNNHILVILTNGISIDLTSVDDVMNFQLNLPLTYKGHTKGLLGTWNDNKEDDFQTPSGTIIPINSSSENIHTKFGVTWRTTIQESLFSYHPGKTHSSYQDVNFRPTFIMGPPSEQAKQLCGSNAMCLYDFEMTGKAVIAQASKQIMENFEKAVEKMQEVTCTRLQTPHSLRAPSNNYSPHKVGDKVDVECNSGYLLSGTKERVCEATGHWSGEETNCYRPKCLNIHGSFANFEDCNTFYNCIFNVPHLRSCQPGLLFNDAKGFCDFAKNVQQPECHKNRPLLSTVSPI